MQKILSSLVILRYVQFCHPNPRRWMHGTRSYVVVIAAYLPILSIRHYCHGVILILRISKI